MKINYLYNFEYPSRAAHNVHIMKMCQSFSNLGHKVRLIGVYNSKSTKCTERKNKKREIYDFYDVDASFEILFTKKSRIRILGFIINSLIVALKGACKKNDLIYTRNDIIAFLTTLLGFPTIYESHVPIDKLYFGKYRKIMFKNLIKKRDFLFLVVISESIKSYYVNKFNINSDDILVARDGSEPITLNETTLSFNNNKKLDVGYIGHLYPGKGMELISNLAPVCPDLMFHIVGGTEQDIVLWKNKLKDVENVNFHGYKKQNNISKYLKSFDVLIAPYKTNVYGSSQKTDICPWMSPLKIFEYMAAGKPILASDIVAINEILTNQKTALLCNPENLDEWKNALEKLENKYLRKKLGKNAKNKFLKKYTWEKRAEKIIEKIKDKKNI